MIYIKIKIIKDIIHIMIKIIIINLKYQDHIHQNLKEIKIIIIYQNLLEIYHYNNNNFMILNNLMIWKYQIKSNIFIYNKIEYVEWH